MINEKRINILNELNHTVFPIVYVNGNPFNFMHVIAVRLRPIKLVNMQL